jgi:hypothetical protein
MCLKFGSVTTLRNPFWRQLHVAAAIKTRRGALMKTTAEYLELALKFELLATFEENPKLKAELEQQSLAYRKLAEAGMKDGPPKISN